MSKLIPEIIAKLFDIGKLPSKVIAWVTVLTGALLFLPDRIQQRLHTDLLFHQHGSYVGLVFLAFSTLLVISLMLWAIGCAKHRMAKRRWRRTVCRRLEELDPSAKAVLREFFLQGKATLALPVDEPTVAGLMREGLLDRVGDLGQQWITGVLFPLALDPDLREILTSQAIGLPTEPTDANMAPILASRPIFMKEIARRESWRAGFN